MLWRQYNLPLPASFAAFCHGPAALRCPQTFGQRRTRTMDWTQVEERIVDDDRNKWDRKAAAAELRITTSDGSLDVGNTDRAPDRYSLSELATTQMCQRLGIPVPYYRRLPDQLRAMVANYDFDRLGDSAFLLRGK